MKRIEKLKAIELRKSGWSTPKIAKELNVAKSTVFMWVKDVELTQIQRDILFRNKGSNWVAGVKKHIEKCKNKRLDYQKVGATENITDDWMHAAGCMLYWAEGHKRKNTLAFTNTDKNMVKFFIDFIRKFYHVENEQITISFQYHTQNDLSKEDIFNYWIDLLKLEGCRKSKPYCKDKFSSSSTRKTKHKYGIVRLQVSNTEIVNKIWGSIQKYIGFSEPEMLK